MPFTTGLFEAPIGITVPYGPETTQARQNHGFTDLRGNPQAAAAVAEALASPALTRLLTDLAQPGARFFTVACDLGAGQQQAGPGKILEMAGGYVQLMAAAYATTPQAHYEQLAEHLAKSLRHAAGADVWDAKFALKNVTFNLDGFGQTVKSLDVWFSVYTLTADAALASRERLITCLRAALSALPRG